MFMRANSPVIPIILQAVCALATLNNPNYLGYIQTHSDGGNQPVFHQHLI